MYAIKYQYINTKTMKTDRFSDYLAPQVDIVKVSAEGVLCTSEDPMGFGIMDMDVKEGGAGTDWDWM